MTTGSLLGKLFVDVCVEISSRKRLYGWTIKEPVAVYSDSDKCSNHDGRTPRSKQMLFMSNTTDMEINIGFPELKNKGKEAGFIVITQDRVVLCLDINFDRCLS